MAFLTNGYTVSNNYAFGASTTFYAVEEAVFNALYQSAWQNCQNSLSTSTKDASAKCEGLYFDLHGGRIHCPEHMNGVQAEIFEINGSTVWKGQLQNGQSTEALGPGVYLLRTPGSHPSDKGCVLKLATFR
jgi:hypothetical protein